MSGRGFSFVTSFLGQEVLHSLVHYSSYIGGCLDVTPLSFRSFRSVPSRIVERRPLLLRSLRLIWGPRQTTPPASHRGSYRDDPSFSTLSVRLGFAINRISYRAQHEEFSTKSPAWHCFVESSDQQQPVVSEGHACLLVSCTRGPFPLTVNTDLSS